MVQFIVGASFDYTDFQNTLHELVSNAELKSGEGSEDSHGEAPREGAQAVLEGMVGAVVQESDTGVMITDAKSRIVVWHNGAVLKKMLRIDEAHIIGTFPWEIPLQPETMGTTLLRDLQHFITTVLHHYCT